MTGHTPWREIRHKNPADTAQRMADLATRLAEVEARLGFLEDLLDFMSEYGDLDALFFNRKPYVNCNDIFAWATADAEEVTPENLHVLKEAYADIDALPDDEEGFDAHVYGGILFCARVRKMRPQGALYLRLPQPLADLFDAAGPRRETDFWNPKPHPADPEGTKDLIPDYPWGKSAEGES